LPFAARGRCDAPVHAGLADHHDLRCALPAAAGGARCSRQVTHDGLCELRGACTGRGDLRLRSGAGKRDAPHVGIALVATGVVLVVANVGLSLPAARERDVTWFAVALALTALSSTLVLGVVL